MAMIAEHLRPSHVAFREDCASKIAVLRDVVGLMVQTGAVTNEEECLIAIQERERLMTTGIGKGVALPHAFTPAAPETAIAYLRIENGVEFDAVDEKLVHHLFCILGPPSAQGRHLKILARLARLLNHGSFLEALSAAQTPEDLVAKLRTQEETLQPPG